MRLSLLVYLVYCGHYWPLVSALNDRWWWLWRNWWNKDWQEKLKYSKKTCPSPTLYTTNPTWLDPGSTPGRRCGKPATRLLGFGAAIKQTWCICLITAKFCAKFTRLCLDYVGLYITAFLTSVCVCVLVSRRISIDWYPVCAWTNVKVL
jgi:hypothetical protein